MTVARSRFVVVVCRRCRVLVARRRVRAARRSATPSDAERRVVVARADRSDGARARGRARARDRGALAVPRALAPRRVRRRQARSSCPAGIGIDITNPAVHTFDVDGQPAYGGIDPPCDQPCISPLHTHDVTGHPPHRVGDAEEQHARSVLHRVGRAARPNCVATYCKPADADRDLRRRQAVRPAIPRTIALTNRKEIAIVVGTPPAQIPNTADWSRSRPVRGIPSGPRVARQSPVHLSSQED